MDKDVINVHLGKKLRARRRLLGMTQQQLAETSGAGSQKQIHKFEHGATMYANTLWKLAEALEVSVGYFYEGLARA